MISKILTYENDWKIYENIEPVTFRAIFSRNTSKADWRKESDPWFLISGNESLLTAKRLAVQRAEKLPSGIDASRG